MSLSGVGTHGQNGLEEQSIQTIINSARMIIMHQALLWPEYVGIQLCSFGLQYAVIKGIQLD